MSGGIASHLHLQPVGNKVGSHTVGRSAGVIERELFKVS